jgi:hypothetical protein
MTENPSSKEFTTFKDFVRKIVSVPKSEIDTIKEEESKKKKKAPKNSQSR